MTMRRKLSHRLRVCLMTGIALLALITASLVQGDTSRVSAHTVDNVSDVSTSGATNGTAQVTVPASGPFPFTWNAPERETILSVSLNAPGTYYDGSDGGNVACPSASSSDGKTITINAVDTDDPTDPNLSGSCTYTVALGGLVPFLGFGASKLAAQTNAEAQVTAYELRNNFTCTVVFGFGGSIPKTGNALWWYQLVARCD